jgi:hypothetical protein
MNRLRFRQQHDREVTPCILWFGSVDVQFLAPMHMGTSATLQVHIVAAVANPEMLHLQKLSFFSDEVAHTPSPLCTCTLEYGRLSELVLFIYCCNFSEKLLL